MYGTGIDVGKGSGDEEQQLGERGWFESDAHQGIESSKRAKTKGEECGGGLWIL